MIEKCLHILPQSYLGVATTEEEEAGVHGRAAATAEETGSSGVDGGGGD
jgi:hypothetical protein